MPEPTPEPTPVRADTVAAATNAVGQALARYRQLLRRLLLLTVALVLLGFAGVYRHAEPRVIAGVFGLAALVALAMLGAAVLWPLAITRAARRDRGER